MGNIVKLMENNKIEAKMKLSSEDLDSILWMRFLVARLGEAPCFAWWDKSLDATDFDGGGSFFQKLVPDENLKIGYISAIEAVIESARSLELKKSKLANNQDIQLSIFHCPPEIESDLNDRIFHLKRFPSEIPEYISKILDSKAGKEMLVEELKSVIKKNEKPKSEGTTIGLKILEKFDLRNFSISQYYSLASLIELKQGEWIFPYYG